MLPIVRLLDAYEATLTINREGIPGDIVECGVWNGGCIGLMALANKANPGPPRSIQLFDSFEGLPQPSVEDVDVLESFLDHHPTEGLHDDSTSLEAIGACVGSSKDSVEQFLVRRLGLSPDELHFHVGWFQDTVPRSVTAIKDIGLLRLDGDWYDSTKVCLEGLFDKVVKGGYVIIDDYGTFQGCRKAVDDFFASRGIAPEIHSSDSDCVYFRR
jgi:O-methyltransferase